MSFNPENNSYDILPRDYADFAGKSFPWLYIEKPALDDALAGYYERGSEVRVLDIGCGSGRVISHLVEHGVSPKNIMGIDPSEGMLTIAAQELPQEVGLAKYRAAEMPFLDESFHLVVSNMVMHAMNAQEAEATIKRVSEVLRPGGDFFFIDSQPDTASNIWTRKPSPWGATLDVFDHDMDAILHETAPKYGLTCVDSYPLKASETGRADDPAEYARYTAGDFRMAALLRKAESSGSGHQEE